MVARILLLLLVPLMVVASGGPPAQEPPCTDYVPGVGIACPTEDGLLEVWGQDGTPIGTTHGMDRGEEVKQFSGRMPPSAAPPRMPHCVDGLPGEFYAKVIHARAFDDGPGWERDVEHVRSLVMQGNGLVDLSAQVPRTEDLLDGPGGDHADLRVQCAQGQVKVHREILWTPLALTDMTTIVQDLQRAGYDDPLVKHWVLFDDTQGCPGCLGIANFFPDPTKAVTNLNNGNAGPMYAITFRVDEPRTMLHELGHNLGAIQNGAPNSDGGAHCTDGPDILCTVFSGDCQVQEFDCGRDDYFHTDPPSGSYLHQNWNLGDVMNRYIAFNGSVVDRLQCVEDGFVDQGLPCTFAGGNLEADAVRFFIDWGDGSPVQVDGPAPIKAPRIVDHAYTAPGTYQIHVWAEDIGGAPGASGRVPFDVRISDALTPVTDCTGNVQGGSFKDCPVQPGAPRV